MESYDLLILGGGICGMTAAIYAARANLTVCILEEKVCGGLVNWTNTVENVPSYPNIHGEEFMDKCREHVSSLGVDIKEVEGVERANLTGLLKKLVSSEAVTYEGKAVIIATGRHPTLFPVKTDFMNVHYCSICDGTLYKDKDIVVVGGGNSGFDESLFLANIGVKSIHIVEVLPKCIAAARAQEKARECGKIRISTSTRIKGVDPLHGDKGRVCFEDTSNQITYEEDVDGIFCFIGQTPNSRIFESVLEMEDGYIKTNADMETKIPGVFAGGDVIVKKYRQITTAMGDGTIAALQAERYIRGLYPLPGADINCE